MSSAVVSPCHIQLASVVLKRGDTSSVRSINLQYVHVRCVHEHLRYVLTYVCHRRRRLGRLESRPGEGGGTGRPWVGGGECRRRAVGHQAKHPTRGVRRRRRAQRRRAWGGVRRRLQLWKVVEALPRCAPLPLSATVQISWETAAGGPSHHRSLSRSLSRLHSRLHSRWCSRWCSR